METALSWWISALVFSGLVLLIVKAMRIGSNSTPWMTVETINNINATALKNAGIRGIIFDVDNTLTGYHDHFVHEDVVEAFAHLRDNFKIAIFSNTCSQARYKELQKIFIGIAIVQQCHKKPDAAGFTLAATMMSLHPSAMVMIGDRTLTDIVGGNLAGMKTIKVTKTLSTDSAPAWYTFLTWLEQRIRGGS